jgi:hypothetical protein
VQGAASWSLVQDVAKASTADYDSGSDLIEIKSYGDGDIQKTVSIAYRPRSSGVEQSFSGSLERTTSGPSGEFAMRNPYIRDHVVADRLLSYWTKRLNTLRSVRGNDLRDAAWQRRSHHHHGQRVLVGHEGFHRDRHRAPWRRQRC